jgi:phosphatidylglycerol---prolipoprotein diacylglyceryl transferase
MAERHASEHLLGRRNLLGSGVVQLQPYTLMLYIGTVAGIGAGAAVASPEGESPTAFAGAAIVLLAPTLVAARLWFVLQHRDLFRVEPRRIWRRSEGGSSLFGGLLASLVLSEAVIRPFGLPFWGFWDAAAVAMLVGLIVTRFGCLMNGCCYGRETTGVVGLWLPDERGEWRRRLPTQLFEAGWGMLLLALALFVRPTLGGSGGLFALIAAGYGFGRMLLEPTRASSQAGQWLRLNMGVAFALFISGLLILAYVRS